MKLVLAWLFVVIPLGWGVTQSVNKSMPLFRGTVSVTPPAK